MPNIVFRWLTLLALAEIIMSQYFESLYLLRCLRMAQVVLTLLRQGKSGQPHFSMCWWKMKYSPLKPWLMKPYTGRDLDEPKRIFNYRLFRAKRTIDNSFGILSARWRIFRRPTHAIVKSTEAIVRATVCLHNYMQVTDNA